MPYKKKIILSSSVLFGGTIGLASSPSVMGIEINAANIGNRIVNITFLGYAIKKNRKFYKMYPINRTDECKKTIQPYEIMAMNYTTSELLGTLANENEKFKIYIYAVDSEGKEYTKKMELLPL